MGGQLSGFWGSERLSYEHQQFSVPSAQGTLGSPWSAASLFALCCLKRHYHPLIQCDQSSLLKQVKQHLLGLLKAKSVPFVRLTISFYERVSLRLHRGNEQTPWLTPFFVSAAELKVWLARPSQQSRRLRKAKCWPSRRVKRRKYAMWRNEHQCQSSQWKERRELPLISGKIHLHSTHAWTPPQRGGLSHFLIDDVY